MEIIIHGRGMTPRPETKELAKEKLGQALQRYVSAIPTKVDIELRSLGGQQNEQFECRVSAHMPRGRTITICETGSDIMACINLAHDRLVLQAKREAQRKRQKSRTKRRAQRNRAIEAKRQMVGNRETWEREVEAFERAAS